MVGITFTGDTCVRAASNDLRIATEHNELTRKGPRKQSKIFAISVSLK